MSNNSGHAVLSIFVDEEACSPLRYVDERVTNYVAGLLGDRCVTPSIVVPTVVVYGLILTLGVFGNVCTCLVIMRNKYMQNATNYYLASLAVSDLLMLILGLPMELYGVFDVLYPYRFGEFVCKLRAFLIEFTSDASILTITCFSIERWLAICFPLRVKIFSTTDRAVKVIVAVWICAFIASLPVANIVVLNRMPLPDFVADQPELISKISVDNRTIVGTDFCAMDFERLAAQRGFIISAFVCFFLLPALLITCVYCHIFCQLQRHCRSVSSTLSSPRSSTVAAAATAATAATTVAMSHWSTTDGNSNSSRRMNDSISSTTSNAKVMTENSWKAAVASATARKKLSKSSSIVVNGSSSVTVGPASVTTAGNHNINSNSLTLKRDNRARKSSIKILFAVVLMFFLCWLPFHLQRLLSLYLNGAMNNGDNWSATTDDGTATSTTNEGGWSSSTTAAAAVHSIFNVVFYISGYCFYSNSACNPILYNILSEKYRLAFCKTILGARLTDKIWSSRQQHCHRHVHCGGTIQKWPPPTQKWPPPTQARTHRPYWVTNGGSTVRGPAPPSSLSDVAEARRRRQAETFRRFWSFDENDAAAVVNRDVDTINARKNTLMEASTTSPTTANLRWPPLSLEAPLVEMRDGCADDDEEECGDGGSTVESSTVPTLSSTTLTRMDDALLRHRESDCDGDETGGVWRQYLYRNAPNTMI